jgi:hypothetical protein
MNHRNGATPHAESRFIPVMSNSRFPFAVASLLIMVSCATSCTLGNHTFENRKGVLPDVVKMSADHQELPLEDDSLVEISWLPLWSLDGQGFEESDAEFRDGMTYFRGRGMGPLFFVACSESYHYDRDLVLYEKQDDASLLWGLWGHRENVVRVPSGWRVATRSSLLFGLLNWPDMYYMDQSEYDGVGPLGG